MITPDQFVTKARELLGVPYVHQGRDPALGVDCIGVIVWPLKQLAYVPRDPALFEEHSYRRYPDPALLLAAFRAEADQIEIDDARAGDIFLMTLERRMMPQHVALVSQIRDGVPYIIHTRETTPTVVEHWLDPESRSHVYSAWRLKIFSEVQDA